MAAPAWYAVRGGVRFLAPSEEAAVTRALTNADPASLDERWAGIVVLQGPYGWAWRTFPAGPTVSQEVVAKASGPEEWAVYRAPPGVEEFVQAAEKAEAQAQANAAALEAEFRRLEAKSRREAEEMRLRLLLVAASASFGAWLTWALRRTRSSGERPGP